MMSYPIPQWLYLKMLTEQPRPDTAELRAQAAAAIGKLDAWLATGTRIEHRATKPVRCGMCGDPHYRTGANACCLWSAGLLDEHRAQPRQFTTVDGEFCEIEFRTGQILNIR